MQQSKRDSLLLGLPIDVLASVVAAVPRVGSLRATCSRFRRAFDRAVTGPLRFRPAVLASASAIDACTTCAADASADAHDPVRIASSTQESSECAPRWFPAHPACSYAAHPSRGGGTVIVDCTLAAAIYEMPPSRVPPIVGARIVVVQGARLGLESGLFDQREWEDAGAATTVETVVLVAAASSDGGNASILDLRAFTGLTRVRVAASPELLGIPTMVTCEYDASSERGPVAVELGGLSGLETVPRRITSGFRLPHTLQLIACSNLEHICPSIIGSHTVECEIAHCPSLASFDSSAVTDWGSMRRLTLRNLPALRTFGVLTLALTATGLSELRLIDVPKFERFGRSLFAKCKKLQRVATDVPGVVDVSRVSHRRVRVSPRHVLQVRGAQVVAESDSDLSSDDSD